ncbi:MAG: hypothetical protein ACRDZU_16480 [Acidimicrobiales bacterium]
MAAMVLGVWLVARSPARDDAEPPSDRTAAVTDGHGSDDRTAFGVLLSWRQFGLDTRLRLAQELGVDNVRSRPVLVPSWDGTCEECPAIRDAGMQLVLTIRNSASAEASATAASDIGAYQSSVGRILDAYRPVLAVVENEEDTQKFFSGTATEYAAQLSAVCVEAHQRGIKCANGGLLSGSVAYLVYEHYLDAGETERARSFGARAFEGFQTERLSTESGRASVRQQVERLEDFIATYASSGADYLNFHWYIPDADALAESVRYLEELSGLPAITNEIGQRDDDADTTRALLEQVRDLGLPYAIWFSSDARLARALVDPDGGLRSTGVAFRDVMAEDAG